MSARTRATTALQVLAIATLWLACDAATRHWALPCPAGVLGLALLLAGLFTGAVPLRAAAAGAGVILGDMLLFFIPPLLAISKHGELFSPLGLKVALCMAVAALLVMAAVGTVVARLAAWERRRTHPDAPDDGAEPPMEVAP